MLELVVLDGDGDGTIDHGVNSLSGPNVRWLTWFK